MGGAAVVSIGLAAVLSHLLLDSFYNHNQGVMIGWPINEYRLNLSLPWFQAMAHAPTWEFARVLAIEAAFYGPVLLVCVAARQLVIRSTRRAVPRLALSSSSDRPRTEGEPRPRPSNRGWLSARVVSR